MPDDTELLPLWTMTNTEDLLRWMWEQGEFSSLGIVGDEAFDLALANDAFRRYWEQQVTELGTATFWGVPADNQEVFEFVIACQEGTQEEYLKGKETSEIIKLYSNTLNAISELNIFYLDEIELQRNPAYGEGYIYLQALEAGEPLPFLPSLPPFMAPETNFDPDLAKKNVVERFCGSEDAEDCWLYRLSDVLDKAGVLYGGMDSSSYFYPIWEAIGSLPGISPEALVNPEASADSALIAEALKLSLGEDYNTENLASLSYNFAAKLLGTMNNPSEAYLYEGEVRDLIYFSTSYLGASEFDRDRQATQGWKVLLASLNAEIESMPNEIVGIPVNHITQGFQLFYLSMMRSMAEPMREKSAEMADEEEQWSELTKAPDFLKIFLGGIEVLGSILYEPLDYILTTRDVFIRGEKSAALGYLPFITGTIGKAIGKLFRRGSSALFTRIWNASMGDAVEVVYQGARRQGRHIGAFVFFENGDWIFSQAALNLWAGLGPQGQRFLHGGGILAHENILNWKGKLTHTVSSHVGRTQTDLAARLVAEYWIKAASTFRTTAEAEYFITRTLDQNDVFIQSWLRSNPLVGNRPGGIVGHFSQSTGVVLQRGSSIPIDGYSVLVFIEYNPGKVPGSPFIIVTAYPAP